GPAGPLLAPDVCPGQPESFAKEVAEEQARLDVRGYGTAVDGHPDVVPRRGLDQAWFVPGCQMWRGTVIGGHWHASRARWIDRWSRVVASSIRRSELAWTSLGGESAARSSVMTSMSSMSPGARP